MLHAANSNREFHRKTKDHKMSASATEYKSSKLGRVMPIVLVLVAIGVFASAYSGNNGYTHLKQAEQELNQLRALNAELESKISQRKSEIEMLRNNDFVLEKQAREQYGLSKSDETVYVFEKHTAN